MGYVLYCMARPWHTVCVWLDYSLVVSARVLPRNQSMAALKVLIAVLSDEEKNGTWDELGMLKVIQERNPQSDGYRHICQLLDNFTHQGPNGNHSICLVWEVMKLNVLSLDVAFWRVMPFPLLGRLSKHLLRALQCLHDECGIIHTGKAFFNRFQVLIFWGLLRYQRRQYTRGRQPTWVYHHTRWRWFKTCNFQTPWLRRR